MNHAVVPVGRESNAIQARRKASSAPSISQNSSEEIES